MKMNVTALLATSELSTLTYTSSGSDKAIENNGLSKREMVIYSTSTSALLLVVLLFVIRRYKQNLQQRNSQRKPQESKYQDSVIEDKDGLHIYEEIDETGIDQQCFCPCRIFRFKSKQTYSDTDPYIYPCNVVHEPVVENSYDCTAIKPKPCKNSRGKMSYICRNTVLPEIPSDAAGIETTSEHIQTVHPQVVEQIVEYREVLRNVDKKRSLYTS